ncbi:hypothetical protein [Roseibaca sp. Y0-43]|uniref:hypothetical protein n=1 Tax=Roseibaca sp. Y0-43 TaxID=2816854 RepID=UPI001D0CB092|nr:hypothetical protein [Roseibaca sp. Y0-43]MCC1481067.1 hypothetical protein [Roseibaca sp. Y0-43]
MTPEIEPTKPIRKELPDMANDELTDDARLNEAIDKLPKEKHDRLAQIAKDMLARDVAPSMKLEMKDDVLSIGLESDDLATATLLQMADIGTRDQDFHAGLVGQIACLGSHKRNIDSANSNFVMAVVRSIEPRDELEAMLATQMGAIHAATMMMARKLNHVNTIPQQDSAERTLNKLARTFTTQMDALKRYRTGGQQKVTVEHVTVNSGGQAIVGAVQTGGGGCK